MTNVFGMLKDKTKKASANDFDGSEFIVKQINSHSMQSINNIDEANETSKKKMKLPLPLSILKSVCLFVGMITLISILRAEVTISEALENAPFVFYILGISFIIFGILQIAEIIKRKKYMSSEEYLIFVEEYEETAARAMQELGIPMTSPKIDIFSYAYKIKKNKDYPVSGNSKYFTTPFFLFQDESTLYLSDYTAVFGFKKNDFVKIEKIAKKTTSLGWNKEDAINSEKYKKYKLTQNQYGTVFYKYYYSLQISRAGKIFEILVPPYEIATLAKLINLPYKE